MSKAIFFDKDGTVIKNVHYNADPSNVQLNEYAGQCLLRLKEAGYKIVIVSNQAGVAFGFFTEKQLAAVNKAMIKLLETERVQIDGLYCCPHHADGVIKEYSFVCDCRKPAPGMILQAARELGVRLTGSWMVGDIGDDVEAGHRAGCSTILLDPSGEERLKNRNPFSKERLPDYFADSLPEVADIILSPYT
jgi:D-glycero-D-manno-heptose 1,7-bisphosphate phosphatase